MVRRVKPRQYNFKDEQITIRDNLFVAPHMGNPSSTTIDLETNKSTIDHVKVKTIKEALYNE